VCVLQCVEFVAVCCSVLQLRLGKVPCSYVCVCVCLSHCFAVCCRVLQHASAVLLTGLSLKIHVFLHKCTFLSIDAGLF